MRNTRTLSLVGLLLALPVYASDPVARITFKVIDDFGNAVPGAPVTASTFLRWAPGPDFGRDVLDQAKGVTDTNGLVTLKLPSKNGNVRYSVSEEKIYFDNLSKFRVGDKPYYCDRGDILRFTNSVAGKWQPWDPTVTLEIKEVLKPIPMYVFSYGEDWDRHKVPEYGKAIGFDLMKADWIAPYGKGETADFIFTLDCKLGGMTSAKYQTFDATLTLTFSNDGDGIQHVYSHPSKGSAFRLPRFAPEDGYATNWSKSTFHHENEMSRDTREDQNYFFRVRTRKDASGKIVSALYGKIHGEIAYTWSRLIKFKYYLNPTPNDRNMEFNPKQHLFTNLLSGAEFCDP
jgi:hypothetical protein